MVFSICPSLRSGLLENRILNGVRVAKRIENTYSDTFDDYIKSKKFETKLFISPLNFIQNSKLSI
jgi:hypothetical protein